MKPSLHLRVLILLGYIVLCTTLVMIEQADGPPQAAQASGVQEPQ